MPGARVSDPLATFSPAAADWFRSAFAEPTSAQSEGWPKIAAGQHTLICAPTGSGKTLAAFLWCLDRLMSEPVPDDPMQRLRVLYVSPLKALVHDVNRNLRAPLAGITLAARNRGEVAREVQVAMRTGDTPAEETASLRQAPAGHPRHHARIPLPAAHLAGARGAARRGVGDPRRDPRPGRHQARRAPGDLARAPRGAHRQAAATHRAVGHAAAAERRRWLPGRPRHTAKRQPAWRAASGADRRRRRPQTARPGGRRSGRGHGGHRRGPAHRATARRLSRGDGRARARSGRRSTRASSS